ncbi:methyltransferase domain-containing protein [Xanthobacter sp. KR7-225]|uniref:class I SAM-dependent methyltransferase n=1 Tax=Xanthobacter sp. KR7-225 TaxID=3156613 RepID=UPI0032B3717F
MFFNFDATELYDHFEGVNLGRNASVTWLKRENASFGRSLPDNSLILDAGSGSQQYKIFFEHCRYESADFEALDRPYAKSTYVCDLSSIPVEDGRFDAIVLNQVLEHLPYPNDVLKELFRVLKPGGRMIATAPFFYEEHDQPYDFFRYTQYAWRRMMADAGFVIEDLHWMEGYLCTVAYQLHRAWRYLPGRPSDIAPGILGWVAAPLIWACGPIFRVLAQIFYRIDEQHRYTSKGFPKNYVCIVSKPE